MTAISALLSYVSKNGRLEIGDERGQTRQGKDVLRELVDEWHLGDTLSEDISDRREAFNIMLSMPRGTDPLFVRRAAREFAHSELSDHKYVMVLHDHQANPHVHLSVRAESRHGKRLSPRKPTCTAGARRSPRSCAGGVSTPRRRVRRTAGTIATMSRSGASRRGRAVDCA